MRVARLGASIAALALLAAVVSAGAAPPKVRPLRGSVRVVFSGQARQVVHRYRIWIFQIDLECYYDKTVDITGTASWTTEWAPLPLAQLAGKLAGRTLVPRAATTVGDLAGQEIWGDCGSEEAPEDWVKTVPCQEKLEFPDAGALQVASAGPGKAWLTVQAPRASTRIPTTCGLHPRIDQLRAQVTIDPVALAKLPPGRRVTVRVGTGSRSSPYAREVNCEQFEAPYEGVQIDDSCLDRLTWSGTVTLIRV